VARGAGLPIQDLDGLGTAWAAAFDGQRAGQAADVDMRRLCKQTSEAVGNLARALEGISQDVDSLRDENHHLYAALSQGLGLMGKLEGSGKWPLDGGSSTQPPSSASSRSFPSSPSGEDSPELVDTPERAVPQTPMEAWHRACRDAQIANTATANSLLEVQGKRAKSTAAAVERAKSRKLSVARDAWRRLRDDVGEGRGGGGGGRRSGSSPRRAEAWCRLRSAAAVESLLCDVRARRARQSQAAEGTSASTAAAPSSPEGSPTSRGWHRLRREVGSAKTMGTSAFSNLLDEVRCRQTESLYSSDWTGGSANTPAASGSICVSLPCRSCWVDGQGVEEEPPVPPTMPEQLPAWSGSLPLRK